MNQVTMALALLLCFIALIGLWMIMVYNQLISLKAMIKEAWSGIDVQLKRRYDLIPNLVNTVKGYSIHEKGVLENIAKFRSASINATSIEGKVQAEQGLTGALKTLFAVAESYPDLKANQNFLELQKQLTSIENDLQLARRYYNGTARNYNIRCSVFPSNLVASMFSFQTEPYFEIVDTSERQAPKVSFE
jgi:LemA protein